MTKVVGSLLRGSDSADAFGSGGSSDPLLLPTENDAGPAAPATGLKVYTLKRANRRMLGFEGPEGRTQRTQIHWGTNNIILNKVQANAAVTSQIGLAWTGTLVAAPIAITNYMTMLARGTMAAATTAGSMIEYRGNSLICSRRSVGGGFHVVFRFGVAQLMGDAKAFFGLRGTASGQVPAAFTNVNPSTLAQLIGFSKDSGDTAYSIMLAAGLGAFQKISLPNTGATGATGPNYTYQVEFFCNPGDAGFGYRVQRYDPTTGAQVWDEGYVTTGNMPAIDMLFWPTLWMANTTAAAAGTTATFAFMSFYCETD